MAKARLFVEHPRPWRQGRTSDDGNVEILDADGKKVMTFHAALMPPNFFALALTDAINGDDAAVPKFKLRDQGEDSRPHPFAVVIDPNMPPNQIRMQGAGGSTVICDTGR